MSRALLLPVNAFVVSILLAKHVVSFAPLLHQPTPTRCKVRRQATPSPSTTTTITKADLEAWKDLPLSELKHILETAERAARAAGQVIIENQGCCSNADEECEVKFNIKDVVTQYDKQAQDALESIIRTEFPTHAFLGEEDVDSGAAASEEALLEALRKSPEMLWIADPIDATANFAASLPLSATTIGVVHQGIPIVGVVYDPHRDELFSAIRGQGATLNGEPITPASAIVDAKDAIINAGCPADPNAFETSMRGVLALNSKCRGLRIIACSALTTAWIASGRVAAHFGYDLSSWDLVAGALLIHEAGGRVSDLDGTPYKLTTRNMLCSNGPIHDEVLGILREADAVSFTRSTEE